MNYHIGNYGNRFEVTGGGRQIAIFRQLEQAESFVSLLDACRKLLDYRRRNTLNWQLEKADDFHRLIRIAMEGLEAIE